MLKFPRTIRLDPSDTFVFERAAEPGEWAVSGAFVFWNRDPATLGQKQRVALRSGDSARALELLETYKSQHAGSDLQDEASLLRIEALAAMGRQAEAAAMAERLVRENPNSPLVDRARSFIRGAASDSQGGGQP